MGNGKELKAPLFIKLNPRKFSKLFSRVKILQQNHPKKLTLDSFTSPRSSAEMTSLKNSEMEPLISTFLITQQNIFHNTATTEMKVHRLIPLHYNTVVQNWLQIHSVIPRKINSIFKSPDWIKLILVTRLGKLVSKE